MIGISVSFCVRDMAAGLVKMEEVERIIGGTAAGPTEVERLITNYAESYWRNYPSAPQIFRELYAAGKIEQPRLLNSRHFPMIVGGRVWMDSEDQITWSDAPRS